MNYIIRIVIILLSLLWFRKINILIRRANLYGGANIHGVFSNTTPYYYISSTMFYRPYITRTLNDNSHISEVCVNKLQPTPDESTITKSSKVGVDICLFFTLYFVNSWYNVCVLEKNSCILFVYTVFLYFLHRKESPFKMSLEEHGRLEKKNPVYLPLV